MKEVELKLQNGKVYKANIAELPIGVVKNITKSINLDQIIKDSKNENDIINKVVFAVIGAYDIFEAHLLNVFDGLTQEELDEFGTPSEIAKTLSEILAYTAFKISGIGESLKKVIAREII
jgi:hypothetical protein